MTQCKDIIRDQKNATRHDILIVESQEWSPSEQALEPSLSEDTPRSKQKDCGNLGDQRLICWVRTGEEEDTPRAAMRFLQCVILFK